MAVQPRCMFMFVDIVYPCFFGYFERIIALRILCNEMYNKKVGTSKHISKWNTWILQFLCSISMFQKMHNLTQKLFGTSNCFWRRFICPKECVQNQKFCLLTIFGICNVRRTEHRSSYCGGWKRGECCGSGMTVLRCRHRRASTNPSAFPQVFAGR